MARLHTNTDIRDIQTQVKNDDLIRVRRSQIVDAAVSLFIKNGYHNTTTRALAKKTGLSIGSLYEYVATKDDVLYLVCMAIHAEVERGVTEALVRPSAGTGALAEIIKEFFLVCDRMSDHMLLMYQVAQFLPPKWQSEVLEAELRMTDIFINAIRRLRDAGKLPPLPETMIALIGHNISVLGHAWAFRRWFFVQHFNIEQYIEKQTNFILSSLRNEQKKTEL